MDKENKEDVGNDIQGKDIEMDILTGSEIVEVGMKRRVRTPLPKIPGNGMTGKKLKMEGEVLTLSKLLAQLGAAVAIGQPHQEP